MQYYCYLDSGGSLGCTNLQLYSLSRAADEWNELIQDIKETDIENINYLKERFAFILSCLGLSLSQLMGQNCQSIDNKKMAQPGILLSSLLNNINTEKETRRRLNSTFKDFLKYYGAIRHFGKIKNNRNYHTVDRLTYDKLNLFRKMTIEIWDLVIAMHRTNKNNELEEFQSIKDVVWFDEIAEQINPADPAQAPGS